MVAEKNASLRVVESHLKVGIFVLHTVVAQNVNKTDVPKQLSHITCAKHMEVVQDVNILVVLKAVKVVTCVVLMAEENAVTLKAVRKERNEVISAPLMEDFVIVKLMVVLELIEEVGTVKCTDAINYVK